MNVGATPAPHFADFVAAAAARRAAGDRPSPALRLAEPLPLPGDSGQGDILRRVGPLGGYQDILDLADAVPETLDRATVLAVATRALRQLASMHGRSVAEVAHEIGITQPERAPARNTAQSLSALATSLILNDEKRGLVTVDLHAARVAQGMWEIAVYDQSTTTSGAFPYSAPPVLVMHASVDARQAQFAAASMLAGAFALRAESAAASFARRPALWAGLTLVAILMAFGLAFVASPLAGLSVGVAALVVLRWIDRRARESSGG
ncbi:MAG: hypothetical protein KDJ44_00620 [Rhodoblastus sp.]|nr:hypothetical protein [Rhodoblastus sp.]